MCETQPPQVSREERLRQAYQSINEMQLGDREAAVKLALKAMLVVRGALHPDIFTGGRGRDIYPTIAKYVRASNAETLSELIDDVLDNISPEFVAHPILGDPVAEVYGSDDTAKEAMNMLREETIPLVILMKKVYQQFIAPEEEAEEQPGAQLTLGLEEKYRQFIAPEEEAEEEEKGSHA